MLCLLLEHVACLMFMFDNCKIWKKYPKISGNNKHFRNYILIGLLEKTLHRKFPWDFHIIIEYIL